MSFVRLAPELVAAAASDLAGIGSALSAANAGVLPIEVDGPDYFVTADAEYLIDAIEDLAAGSLPGFIQNLQLIPAADPTLLVAGVAIPGLAAPDIVAGDGFPL